MKHLKPVGSLCLLVWLCSAATFAQTPAFDFSKSKTFGTMGKQQSVLKPNVEVDLFSHTGKGCLTHMWFGGDWAGYDKTRLRIYVDGETTPSIDMEMNLGHDIGFTDATAPWGISKVGRTGTPSGIYNTYRIPFGKSIRVTAQLGAAVIGSPQFWWIIRGTENLPVKIGNIMLPENARLKLYKKENSLAKSLEEFDLCNTTKNGCLYHVMIAANSINFNYMEGKMRAYIGEKDTLFLSSGMDNYFLGTNYFKKGKFITSFAGVTHSGTTDYSFSAFRFHDNDPVFFQQGLRLTTRCGEQEESLIYGGNPQQTTFTSYVWTYEWDEQPNYTINILQTNFNINIYPNPFIQNVTFKINSGSGLTNGKIYISNMMGQIEDVINIDNLLPNEERTIEDAGFKTKSAGMYIVNFEGSNEKKSKMIVKQ